MAINLAVLKSEIDTDPEGLGYDKSLVESTGTGWDTGEIADALNDPGRERSVDRQRISTEEIRKAAVDALMEEWGVNRAE